MADEIKKEVAEPSKSKPKAEKAKKDTAAKKSASAKDEKDKKANIFVRMGKAIAKFFKDEKGECKKIVWPDRKTVLKSTAVVFVVVAILAVILWLVDTGLSEGVKALINLAEKVGSEGETEAAVTEAGRMISGLLGM